MSKRGEITELNVRSKEGPPVVYFYFVTLIRIVLLSLSDPVEVNHSS